MAHPLQRVLVDFASPRKIASAGGALYLILFKDDATRMGRLYHLRSKMAANAASATKKFLADVGGGFKGFRTDNGTECAKEIIARLCSDQTIRHEYTGVDESKHNGVADRGLGLIQEGRKAACLEPPRLFPRELPNFDRYWVEAAIYMNDCLYSRRPPRTSTTNRPSRCFLGDYGRSTPSPSFSPDFVAYTAPTSRSPKLSGASTLTRGGTTHETT